MEIGPFKSKVETLKHDDNLNTFRRNCDRDSRLLILERSEIRAETQGINE